jgi:hypothetical protein
MLRQRIAVLTFVLATIAAAVVPASPSAAGSHAVDFAGYQWTVKHSEGQVGPGPNVFAADNVEVDRRGRLRLRIDERDGVWRSSEVILDEALGYGTYRFTVQSRLGDLDPNVVLGLFTWSDEPAQNNREIDIEFSKWANAANPYNAGYTVQPYDVDGHQHQWSIGNQQRTTHEFEWSPDGVRFRSTDRRGRELASWTFSDTAAIPDPETAHARINLWLFRGNAPTDGEGVRITIRDFEFIPAG